MYTYTHTCPDCGKHFRGVYLKPYKTARVSKTCLECSEKAAKNGEVEDLGGLKSGKGCGSCIHFSEEKNGWGRCGLGKSLNNEEEYTLTYAIDNLSCHVKFDEHENYGDDLTGLVYGQDTCSNYQSLLDYVQEDCANRQGFAASRDVKSKYSLNKRGLNV